MFSPGQEIGLVVDYTEDTLPAAMRRQLDAYGPQMFWFRERADGYPTTRGKTTLHGHEKT